MSKRITMSFRIMQDPCDHPLVDHGVHTVEGECEDTCWDAVNTIAHNICWDEWTIYLVETKETENE